MQKQGCRWDRGGAGPCAEIMLLLFPKRWQSCSSWEHSSALPVPLSRVWVWSHVRQWDGWCVTLWNRWLGKLFLGEKLPASPRGWHCPVSMLAHAFPPTVWGKSWSLTEMKLSKDSDKPSVWSGQQRRAEGAELPLLCNFLISSKKPWCGCGICINV